MLVTTTPATDRSLLSLAEMKTAIGVTGSDSVRDAKLIQTEAQVTAAMVRACKIVAGGVTQPTFRVETLTETLRPTRRGLAWCDVSAMTSRIILARRPIISVTSVVEDDETLTEGDDFEYDANQGLLIRLVSDVETTWSMSKVVAVYTAGWATVPDDLKLAATKMLVGAWFQDDRDPMLRRDKVEGVGEKEYWDPTQARTPLLTVPTEILQLLGPYIQHTSG